MVLVNAMHISAKLGIRSNKVWAADLLEENQQLSSALRGRIPAGPAWSSAGIWELAVLPGAEAYSVATPTECVLFLAIAVSWITSTASLPPTSLSAWKSSSVSQALLPRPRRNEVVQLIAFAERKPPRHRLNALAIARADQPRYVERTHLAPRLLPQPIQKRLRPT